MPLMSVKLRNMFKKDFPKLEVHLKNIRINGDPRGCSGFVVNPENGRIAYLDTESSVYSPLAGKVLYRTAQHLKDYTGGPNQWSTPEEIVWDVADLIK